MTDMDKMMIEKVAAAIYESSARTVADARPEFEALDHVSRNTFKLHARAAISAYNPDDRLREAWQPIETAWRVGDQRIIVTDGAEVHGAGWWHSGEEAWLDCGGITPTHWQPLPEPPALSPLPQGDG